MPRIDRRHPLRRHGRASRTVAAPSTSFWRRPRQDVDARIRGHDGSVTRALECDISPQHPPRPRHRRHVHGRGAGGGRPPLHREDTHHAARTRAGRGGGAAVGHGRGRRRARPGEPDRARHDARDQRHHRAQGRQDRAAHHRGLPRRGRDPPREPVRAIRRQHRPAAAAGAAPAALSGARADRCAGQRAAAARRGQPRDRNRRARGAEGRGGGGRLPAQLHQSGARAPRRRRHSQPAARDRGDALVRGVAGDARIRAILHRVRQCLHPAADGALSHQPGARDRARRLQVPDAADELGRRDHDGRDRDPLSGAPRRVGTGGRCDLRGLHCAPARP